jgi:uncharacterized integral membrane protein
MTYVNPTPSAKAIHSQLPIPQPPQWSGYWTFVTALILFMFVLYVAQKGTLTTWLSFFAWTTPQPVGNATSAGAVSGAITNPLTGATISPGLSSNPLAGLSTSVSGFLGPTLSGMLGIK